MAIFDVTIDSLKKYYGSSPRPDDFDEYWDNALKEMRAIDPQVELIPADFKVPNAECFDLYFTGVWGARIHAKYLRPKGANKPHPAVLQFHGYSDSAGEWSDKLNYVSIGFSFAALDCRGQGGQSQDVGGVNGNTLKGHLIRGLDDVKEKMFYRNIFLDAAQLTGIIMDMPEVDSKRVGVMGGSQGGGMTLACAALEPRIKKLAPRYPAFCDFKRALELNAYDEVHNYFRLFDPTQSREDEILQKLGYLDVQYLVNRIKGEVLMATGLRDNVCPPSAQFAAYNKITSKKDVIIYPEFGHEVLPGFADKVFLFMSTL